MIAQACNTFLGIVVAVAIALGAILAPASAFAAPLQKAPEVLEFASLDGLDHAAEGDRHLHDDGEPDERGSGHRHGDKPADHSHEKAGVLTAIMPVIASSSDRWLADATPTLNLQDRERLDRPPRASAAL